MTADFAERPSDITEDKTALPAEQLNEFGLRSRSADVAECPDDMAPILVGLAAVEACAELRQQARVTRPRGIDDLPATPCLVAFVQVFRHLSPLICGAGCCVRSSYLSLPGNGLRFIGGDEHRTERFGHIRHDPARDRLLRLPGLDLLRRRTSRRAPLLRQERHPLLVLLGRRSREKPHPDPSRLRPPGPITDHDHCRQVTNLGQRPRP